MKPFDKEISFFCATLIVGQAKDKKLKKVLARASANGVGLPVKHDHCDGWSDSTILMTILL